MGVDANQWASLVAYWCEQETKKKTNQLFAPIQAIETQLPKMVGHVEKVLEATIT
jgi:hypothetical protein